MNALPAPGLSRRTFLSHLATLAVASAITPGSGVASASPLPFIAPWFERITFGNGITLLREPHVHPLLRCNLWVIPGRKRNLLIDTGIGVASLKAAAHDLLGGPVVAVATHAHMDHTGGMHEFCDRNIHALEAQAMANATNHLPLDLDHYDEATRSWLAGMGYDIRSGLLTAIPAPDFDLTRYHLQATTATRELNEGDTIDLGDRAFEVLHLPGHSPGSIGLWEKKTRTLFSGDAIYDGPLLDEIDGADVEAYVKTMRRLRDLPVDVVHAGHDRSFGRQRLVEIVDTYLLQRDRA